MVPRAVIVQSQPIKCISWAPNRFGLLLIQCKVAEPIVYLWDAEGLPAAPITTDDHHVIETAEPTEDETTMRIEAPPQILKLPLEKCVPGKASRLEATWLPRRSEQAPAFVFGDAASFIVVRPRGSDSKSHADKDDVIVSPTKDLNSQSTHEKKPVQLRSHKSNESNADNSRPATPRGDESDDSLYEILTGRSPARVQQMRPDDDEDGETMRIAEMVDVEDGEDDFTRIDDTFAWKKGVSLSDDSEIF